MIVAEEETFAGQQVATDLAALHPGIAGTAQTAETRDAVSFAVDPDCGVPADNLRLAVESSDDGTGIAADVGHDGAAADQHVRGTAHGTDGGGAFTGGVEAVIA